MTPEQRMELMGYVTEWDGTRNPVEGMRVMAELVSFVEEVEFRAHVAGQEQARADLQEYSLCPYRDDDERASGMGRKGDA